MISRFTALAFLTAIAVSSGGCSTSSKLAEPPDYNLSDGDYLTEREFKDLSRDEALAYCQELEQEIDIENDNAALTGESIAEVERDLAELRGRLDSARGGTGALETTIAELEGVRRPSAPADATAPPSVAADSYLVVPGDWLSTIAAKERIYGNWREWRRIFEANRDRIRNPDLIFPGQVLAIPRDETGAAPPDPSTSEVARVRNEDRAAPGTRHALRSGETIRILAEQAYGSREEWKRIWDANRDAIPNPDQVQVGLLVSIP